MPKKIASFKRGLNPKMMKHVGTSMRMGFNDFVSDCLKQEKNNNVYATSKTRKRAFESGPSQPRAPMANHSAYRSPAPGARFRPPLMEESKCPATSEESEAIQDSGATSHDRTRQFIRSCYSSKRTVLQLQSIWALCEVLPIS